MLYVIFLIKKIEIYYRSGLGSIPGYLFHIKIKYLQWARSQLYARHYMFGKIINSYGWQGF